MRLICLEIDNFLKFERLAVEFPDGLTGVLGPNGVGKSSLVEAVAWALYGSDASRAKNEGIPFRRTVPCRVALTLEIEGDECLIVRELRGSSFTGHAEVAVNGVPTEFGTEKVNRWVASRLRMDYRAFLISYFARQKELDALVSWQPRDRKQYILRMLGLERVERAIGDVRRDAMDRDRELKGLERSLPPRDAVMAGQRAAREKVAGLSAQVKDARARLESTEKELAGARQRMEDLERQQRCYTELQHEANLARSALENARSHAEIYAGRVRDLQGKSGEVVRLEPELAPLPGLRERRQALDLAAGLVKRRASLVKSIAGHQKTLEEARAQAAGLAAQWARRDDYHTAREQSALAAAQVHEASVEVQGNIRSNEARLAQIKKEGQKLSSELKQFRELGQKGECPTCRRVLNGSYTAVVEHLEGEMAALRVEHDEYAGFIAEDRARLEQLQGEIRAYEGQLQQLDRQLRAAEQAGAVLEQVRRSLDQTTAHLEKAQTDLAEMGSEEYDAAAHKQVVAQIAALEKVEHRVIGLRHEVAGLPAAEEAVANAEAAIPAHERALAQAEADLAALAFDPAAFNAGRARCRTLEQEQKTQYDACHAIERERERALVEQQQADARREEYDRKVEEILLLRADKENKDELRALMEQFRVNLIGRIRPALAERTSRLARDLTDGKYDRVEVDEDYNLFMYDEGERRELRSFSGGENDLVHLCLRLAISEMIGDAAGGAEHGFLVLDEVLGSQDGERRNLILQALSRLSRRFRQILMITHLDDTKEMVENVIELAETANGSSAIVGA